jgi:transcriptional regulator with PAS, ATPase and Fis domain
MNDASSASTVTQKKHRRGAQSQPLPHLFVAMHCGSPLEAPSRHALHSVDEVCIGRGRTPRALRHDEGGKARLKVSLPDDQVSSAHARLVSRDGEWHIEDLSSKNGTLVNGGSVASARLVDGDCIQVGQTLLVLRTAMATPSDAQVDLQAKGLFPAFATLSPQLAFDLDGVAAVATSRVPILLLSETGTGKELLARAVHELSRRGGPFVPVNCGGLPHSLAESILFGHRRGAFSGAVADQPGLFRAAHRGTLLLDEVGDISPTVQATVLRALQDGEVLAVGDTKPTHVDVRIVAATHRDLSALAVDGGFREDLLSRLSGFVFRLPPLRERREDIGIMVGSFLRKATEESGREQLTISPDAALALFRHDWPGNVRELEKAVERAAAVARDGHIEVEHLPQALKEGPRASNVPMPEDRLQGHIVALLERNRGNVAAVAASMHTSRAQIHRLMKRFSIDPAGFRSGCPRLE